MILSVNVQEKSFGDKDLYHDLSFAIQPNEKVGLIGRNGTGKSTLFNIIIGDDKDYQGEVYVKRGTTVISSRQEHHGHEDKTALEYIQGDLPEYARLTNIIDTYPDHMGADTVKIQRYSEALDRFGQLGYFQIEDEIGQAFNDYQISKEKMHRKMGDLSGGQKRMVELIKVQRSRGNIALIDEPTNHMDFVAKQSFVRWLISAKEAVVVITHDRDVLGVVDRIIEVRDGKAFAFKGNYEHYLRINANQITSQVNEYDLIQRRIRNLGEDIIRFRRLKERSHDPGTIKRFKASEEQGEAELARLTKAEKPSFWIDQDSVGELNPKMTTAYQKYKAQNIKVSARTNEVQSARLLVQADKLSLGYDNKPLFQDVGFAIHEGERIRLHGRNGAGKTTLVDAIVAKVRGGTVGSSQMAGHLMCERDINLGLYEQEIDSRFLPMTLYEALETVLDEHELPISDQHIRRLLSNYLFNPHSDADMPVARLSGGQKARFQLIRMLVNEPQLLILDEPTNHLDLPSIEELESALANYSGAVIYISHDSFFANKLGGNTVKIGT